MRSIPLASHRLWAQSAADFAGSHPNPVPGMPIKSPRVRPARGQVITHYEVFQPQVGLWLRLLYYLPAVPQYLHYRDKSLGGDFPLISSSERLLRRLDVASGKG